MRTNLKLRARSEFIWPAAGFATGMLATAIPYHKPHISVGLAVALWLVDMVLVWILGARPMGARMGVLIAGLCMVMPCFVRSVPLVRGGLMCGAGIAFAMATVQLLGPPIAGARARLAFFCSWGRTRKVARHKPGLNPAALLQLLLGTAIFAAALATVKAVPDSGLWLLARWLAGGVMLFALAGTVTASHNFLAALLGVTAPAILQMPFLATSVNEFWTRRWNPLTALLFRKSCFEPLARRGVGLALFATFLASAILHLLLAYMAIMQWGIAIAWGVFFLVQPLFIAAERRMHARRWRPATGRTWTLAVLAITSPFFVEPALQILQPSWGAPGSNFLPAIVMLGSVICLNGLLLLAACVSHPAAGSLDSATAPMKMSP